ncbi:polyketide cyclase [Streptomyces nitrosporeus]|uniref:Polyketide cyclase n=1 Tax=Streptomyces nitrosporeus TaxID=28894 RepID=A0A5J6FGN2_9ACTN|nr:SRPBCC family protein [Streptomyces nitrosporeus]QEU75442.1 polyketide cyclase [Streptomyces nitrosporeus]GGZ02049.1 polyketide cyclase [Streptomyces nitrosporeus]
MDPNHYRFTSVWELPAPPAAVHHALGRPEDYPRWWPQVRRVTRVDDTTARAYFRSFLPYGLRLTLRRGRYDPAAGVLEAVLGGDLDGWARWTVAPYGTGSRVLYEQEVVVRKALLRRLAVPGRPFFRVNHTLMMRAGRRGLAAWLRAV